MKCRSCGTEIAEKALICFRCGTAVQEAVTRPPARRPVRRRPLTIALVLVLAAVAFSLTQWSDDQMVRGATWLIFALVAIVLLWRERRTPI